MNADVNKSETNGNSEFSKTNAMGSEAIPDMDNNTDKSDSGDDAHEIDQGCAVHDSKHQRECMEKIFIKHSKGSKVIGIGSGRTMELFSKALGNDKIYIPTSFQTEMFLEDKTVSFCGNHKFLDLYFDGTDYYNEMGDLIKGMGGAITLEKLLHKMANRTIIIAQKSKFRESFEGLLVPVVILKESYSYFISKLDKYKIRGILRKVRGVTPFLTDTGNFIVDVEFNVDFLNNCNKIPGVIENGYFRCGPNIVIEEI